MTALSRERLRQLRRVAEGKCRWASCKGKVRQGETCERHRKIINAAGNERYHNKAKPKTRRYRCSRCHGTDHNVARCEEGE